MKVWRILLIVFLICGCTKINPLAATITSIPAPTMFTPFELNFSGPPEFNEPVELTMDVVGGIPQLPNATIKIDLPDGFELVSGDLEWQGNLTKDVPVQLKAVVKPVKTGDWVIEGWIIDSEEGKKIRTALYVSVSEDSVEVSKTPPPGPDANESIRTTRVTTPCPNGTIVFMSNESEDRVIRYSPGGNATFECVLPS
jgi:hypothetical protein